MKNTHAGCLGKTRLCLCVRVSACVCVWERASESLQGDGRRVMCEIRETNVCCLCSLVCVCVCVFVLAPIPPLRQRFNKQHTRIKRNQSVYTYVVHIAACLCCTPLVKTDWMTGRKYNKHLISGDGKRKIFHPCFFGWKICFSIIDSSSL